VTRTLVLGGTGMLGHVVWRACREAGMDAVATMRAERLAGPAAEVLDEGEVLTGVRAEDVAGVARALESSAAETVVNCIGVVKQSATAQNPATTIRINALFPHELATACRERGAKLIHVSTDCVFSGRSGAYVEDDSPDPVDLYGRSKLLGEPGEGALTLRTSMIGRELSGANGLLEWLLAQEGGRVRGFAHAIFSGPTTPVLARAIVDVIARHRELEGLYHLAAEPIDKYQLLCMLRDAFSLELEIERDEEVRIDRSLDPARFGSATGWAAPSWAEMVGELAETAPAYDSLRGSLAHG
jgi:dTDP-4-dehydrorhamnose reductase